MAEHQYTFPRQPGQEHYFASNGPALWRAGQRQSDHIGDLQQFSVHQQPSFASNPTMPSQPVAGFPAQQPPRAPYPPHVSADSHTQHVLDNSPPGHVLMSVGTQQYEAVGLDPQPFSPQDAPIYNWTHDRINTCLEADGMVYRDFISGGLKDFEHAWSAYCTLLDGERAVQNVVNDWPQSSEEEKARMKEMYSAICDFSCFIERPDRNGGENSDVTRARELGTFDIEFMSYWLLQSSIKAHQGQIEAPAYCYDLDYRVYSSWSQRWADMVRGVRKSKTFVKDMLSAPWCYRIAAGPYAEYRRKEQNVESNTKRAFKTQNDRRLGRIARNEPPDDRREIPVVVLQSDKNFHKGKTLAQARLKNTSRKRKATQPPHEDNNNYSQPGLADQAPLAPPPPKRVATAGNRGPTEIHHSSTSHHLALPSPTDSAGSSNSTQLRGSQHVQSPHLPSLVTPVPHGYDSIGGLATGPSQNNFTADGLSLPSAATGAATPSMTPVNAPASQRSQTPVAASMHPPTRQRAPSSLRAPTTAASTTRPATRSSAPPLQQPQTQAAPRASGPPPSMTPDAFAEYIKSVPAPRTVATPEMLQAMYAPAMSSPQYAPTPAARPVPSTTSAQNAPLSAPPPPATAGANMNMEMAEPQQQPESNEISFTDDMADTWINFMNEDPLRTPSPSPVALAANMDERHENNGAAAAGTEAQVGHVEHYYPEEQLGGTAFEHMQPQELFFEDYENQVWLLMDDLNGVRAYNAEHDANGGDLNEEHMARLGARF
ncbi:hypothetical protein B0T17DRAFT_618176 [Bombardia bombarda]|uniref:Uncharacterized protein n=1 Tax=Bombardia bombarda TaxID=252184 RepID=A0AA40C1R8_9PEZI|nr:hypothetical protein B0T17DRAFT_618176 [Bombardia bombarda]